MTDQLRLTEVLTTSTSVATYLGQPTVEPTHLLLAVKVLLGETTMDNLGRPQSPLLIRVSGAGSTVAPDVRDLAQRWFARFDHNPLREFTPAELDEFVAEVSGLRSLSGQQGP